MLEKSIELVEGTTRYEEITCKNQDGSEFDFDGYEIRTWMSFDGGMYVPTVIAGNIVSFEIPASVSVGEKKANIECRIFKNGKVYEVIRFKVNVIPAKKPDLVPVDM